MDKPDGRKKYSIIEGRLCEMGKHVAPCSGCYQTNQGYAVPDEFDYDEKNKIFVGHGCDECGYTGKRVEKTWTPVNKTFGEVKITTKANRAERGLRWN